MPTNFGTTPLSTDTINGTSVSFPVSGVFVPGTASGNITALQGGPSSTDGNNYTSAPMAIYSPDGNDVTLGAKADGANAATDTTAISIMSVLKQLSKMAQAPASTPVTGTFWQATQPVSLASLPALAAGSASIGTVVTNADTTIGGTAAPAKELLIAGKTNDGTPQYQPLPEGAGGRSVIVEGYIGGTAVPVSGTFWQATQPVSIASLPALPANQSVNVNQVAGSNVATAASGIMKVGLTDASGNALNSTSNALNVSVQNAALATNADTTIGGTAAPSKGLLVIGKTNDATPQYQPLPEGAGGRSIIIEGYAGGTAVPVSGTVTANQGSANATPWNENIAQYGGSSVSLGQKASASSMPVVIASDQSALSIQHGNVVDAGNSSTATLTGNSVFTGTGTSSLNYSAIAINVFADQASAAGGLQIEQSQDNSHWDLTDSFSVSASTAFNTLVNLVAQYYRIVYTNGGTNQGAFRLQTVKMVADSVLPRTLTSAGALRVDGSAVTQPVSGTFWQATQPVSIASLPALPANQSVNVAQVAGGNTSNAGQTGAMQVGGAVATNTAVSSATNPLLIAGSDYGGTPKVQTLKVDSAGNAQTTISQLPSAAALADGTSNPTTTGMAAYLMAYNGSTWDRLHEVFLTGDNQGVQTGLYTLPQNLIYNGSNWDRWRGDNTGAGRVSMYGKNSSAGDTAILVDSTGRQLVGVSTTALFTTTQTTVGSSNSGDLDVSKLHEISIDLNTTAQAGTNPTIQFFWERKGADGIYYVLWQSNSLTAASNTLSTSIGPGLAYNQSLGNTGRLRWTVGGTGSPTWTFTPNVYGK